VGSRRTRWMKRILGLFGVALIVILVRLTIFRPTPVPVTVYRAQTGRVEDTVVNSRAGTVKSRQRAQMSPGLAGLVAEIPVKKGELVHKGQLLLRLDDHENHAQVTLAERSLDAARATARQAALAAEQALRDRRRVEALAAQNLASDQVLEEARTRAESAEAAALATREQVKQAEAAVSAAQSSLTKTAMIAPFDGVVLDITTEVGEWISPSPPGVFIPPVIDLISPHALYVSAPLDEADVAKVRVGLPVRITMDAFRKESFAGAVSYVSSFVETRQEQNRTLTIEATLDDRDLPPNVLPGLSADVEVILEAKENVLRIPTYALLEGDRVLVVKGNRLESRAVQPGLRNWEFVEIMHGLIPGDQVVVSLDRAEVKAGAHVRVSGGEER
jgi:HlyD family secretion protein